MKYNVDFWNRYADENDSKFNKEFSNFVRDLAFSLKTKTILEVGCSTGNDLRSFSSDFTVCGIDLNDHGLEIAKQKLPAFNFKKASTSKIPFEDCSIDFVFTHKLLNYLDEEDLDKAFSELYRVSSKYIVNFEIFGDNEEIIDKSSNFRKLNVFKRWLAYKVKIISNVEMHEDIDPEKSRFVLVRKLGV